MAPHCGVVFRNYASLDALRLFSPVNSKNLWASTTKGLVKMGTEPIYYNWGNGLLALPEQHAIGH